MRPSETRSWHRPPLFRIEPEASNWMQQMACGNHRQRKTPLTQRMVVRAVRNRGKPKRRGNAPLKVPGTDRTAPRKPVTCWAPSSRPRGDSRRSLQRAGMWWLSFGRQRFLFPTTGAKFDQKRGRGRAVATVVSTAPNAQAMGLQGSRAPKVICGATSGHPGNPCIQLKGP